MISCDLKGGLGNLLFQIAATYSLALDNNDDCYFDLWSHSNSPRPQKPALDYKNNFFKNIKDLKRMPHSSRYTYDSLTFKKIPYSDKILLDGYFQSEKYFKHHRKEILELFKMPEEQCQQLHHKYFTSSRPSVSVHIRRKDYLAYSNIYHRCDINYYGQALNEFNNCNFYIFSDDIEWCKQVFKGENFIFIENHSDHEELYIMSLCHCNILANSSFSWWGAWLNENPNKIVIAPKQWLKTENCEDVCCENWIRV